MAWLRTAFNICTPDKEGYYTILDPVEFYEWKFTKYAPKGHDFFHQLPPSDIFTEGKIIASVFVPESNLKRTKAGYRLTTDSPVQVKLEVGNMPSPKELIDKYNSMVQSRDRGLDAFKQDLQTRLYLNSQTDDPHLFRLAEFTDEKVTMHNFGSVEKLAEQFDVVRKELAEESMDKVGRSYELEEFRRYENAMIFANNSHLHVDASKMDRLIETSGVRALQTTTVPWVECYLEASPGAQHLSDKIQHFEDQSWVRAAISR